MQGINSTSGVSYLGGSDLVHNLHGLGDKNKIGDKPRLIENLS